MKTLVLLGQLQAYLQEVFSSSVVLVPGPAAAAPGNLEMQIFGPTPESESLGAGFGLLEFNTSR